MIQAWLFDSFLTWIPFAIFLILVNVVSRKIKKALKLNNPYTVLAHFASYKLLSIALLATFLASMSSYSNRPKNDITPNQYSQQSAYKSEIDLKAGADIKEVKSIQHEFDERKDQTKKLFEY